MSVCPLDDNVRGRVCVDGHALDLRHRRPAEGCRDRNRTTLHRASAAACLERTTHHGRRVRIERALHVRGRRVGGATAVGSGRGIGKHRFGSARVHVGGIGRPRRDAARFRATSTDKQEHSYDATNNVHRTIFAASRARSSRRRRRVGLASKELAALTSLRTINRGAEHALTNAAIASVIPTTLSVVSATGLTANQRSRRA